MKTIITILLFVLLSGYSSSQNISSLGINEKKYCTDGERVFLFAFAGVMAVGTSYESTKCERVLYRYTGNTIAAAEGIVAVYIIYPLIKPIVQPLFKKIFKKKQKRRYDLF